METNATVLDAILSVFTSVGTWIAGAVEQVSLMFYNDGALTFLGVLAVSGLAISVVFLIMGVIQNFLHFRG